MKLNCPTQNNLSNLLAATISLLTNWHMAQWYSTPQSVNKLSMVNQMKTFLKHVAVKITPFKAGYNYALLTTYPSFFPAMYLMTTHLGAISQLGSACQPSFCSSELFWHPCIRECLCLLPRKQFFPF